ncbi:hypothetical protein D3C81_1432860 [compost metagenome]
MAKAAAIRLRPRNFTYASPPALTGHMPTGTEAVRSIGQLIQRRRQQLRHMLEVLRCNGHRQQFEFGLLHLQHPKQPAHGPGSGHRPDIQPFFVDKGHPVTGPGSTDRLGQRELPTGP